MEKDEFTAWFDQEEFLWSEEESHIGFMKCHVQKRFQSDVYVNCKPVHRSKCVPVNNFEISKECLSKIKKQKLISNNTAKSAINWWMIYVSRQKRSLIKLNRNLWNFLTICTIFFMNIIKQYKITLHLSEKAFKEYFNEIFTKLLTSEVNNRFICSPGQLSNLYQGILLAISQTVIIQTHRNLIFKSHYCDVINNSQAFEKILTAVRLTFST